MSSLTDINEKLIFIEKKTKKEFSSINALIIENDFMVEFLVKNNDIHPMKNFSINHSSNVALIKGDLPQVLKPGEEFELKINVSNIEGVDTFFEVQSVPTYIEFT